MFCQGFLLGLVILISPLLVSSSVIPATNIHNCSGEATPAPTTYKPYFHSYGPQLDGRHGWEEWTFVLPDTLNQSMIHFRWTRGNPAALASSPQGNGTFSVFYPKTGFKADAEGPFVSKAGGDSSLSISVGKNYLLFDGTKGPYGLWNVSVDINGFKTNVQIDPVTPSVPFEPTVDGEKGLLVPGYHVSHPIYRGHTDGTVTLPSGQTWVMRQVATLKHTYGYTPVQTLVSTYTRVSTFIGPNTLNWYVAKSTGGRDTTAGQFVYGALDLSEITLKYQTTNEPSILAIDSSISPQSHNYTVSIAGCQATLNKPYAFNSTSQVYLGAVPDSAGGKTEYWSLDTRVLFFINGQAWTNDVVGSLGLLEVYKSPKFF